MNDAMGSGFAPGTLHRETAVEELFVSQLVKLQGYCQRSTEDHDRAAALDKALVLDFVQRTQPQAFAKLSASYGASAEAMLFTQLDKALKDRGTLDVLRRGLKIIPNIEIQLCAFRPASAKDPALLARYEANTLSVIRQVRYSLKNENCIDAVLYMNGVPVATLEFKNTMTDSSFRDAEAQYRTARPPAGEPLLTFKRGALVHFALDQDNVSMTTRLQNGRTRFLPFNRGRNGGAGNPDVRASSALPISMPISPEHALYSPATCSWTPLGGLCIWSGRTGGKR
jgi:type I restriction enzyme R subunit